MNSQQYWSSNKKSTSSIKDLVYSAFLMIEEKSKSKPENDEGSVMQRLHAYWRMPYILGQDTEKPAENPFSKMQDSKDDQSNHIIFRGQFNFIVMNRYPYNAGHLLVLPYRPVAKLADLEKEERYELMDLIIEAQNILQRALKPDGFNTGFNFGKAAGAGIPSHLHCHVVPRWNGDTNFMPVIAETKVIPEAMDAMWERLVKATTV
jgi:ATP adenylyltransferase